jgi:hypothetical protein
MIELAPTEHDDVEFVALVQWILNGALAALEVREVYLVHTDNWFDWKWLGFWSRGDHKELTELRIPPFNPNRICLEKHFVWDAAEARWMVAGHSTPLHVMRPGPSLVAPEPLDRWSKSAAFIWYSGNSTVNRAGSLMFYLSGAGTYAWYASFRKNGRWKVNGERRIGRRELSAFEDRGRDLELGSVQ